MPRRLAIALCAAILVHAALGALLFWISLWPQRHAAALNEAGGVVWFNLNPGGAGSGGEGGLGAPQAADPKAGAPTVKPGEIATAAGPEIPAKKKKVLKVTPQLPEAAPNPTAKQEGLPPGWQGPGEGDSSGTKAGPGGGQGEGLGPGAGAGSGGEQGPGGVGAPGTGGSGQGGEASAILARIRQKIARAKRYPRQARTEELEGVCGIAFEINPDGSVPYVNLTSSSGHRILDEEAVATVRRAAPFPYYAGPIRFSLRFSLKEK